MKWFATLDFGFPSMQGHALIEAETESEAWDIAYEQTIEQASGYGFEQDEDYFDCLDDVGADWDDEDESYGQTGQIAPGVEPYDPIEHGDYL
jgi:hypothetical protein